MTIVFLIRVGLRINEPMSVVRTGPALKIQKEKV